MHPRFRPHIRHGRVIVDYQNYRVRWPRDRGRSSGLRALLAAVSLASGVAHELPPARALKKPRGRAHDLAW